MRITKIEEGDTIEEAIFMGGDLNREEPMNMEDFSKRQATWILLKKGEFVPYMQAMVGYNENCLQ